MTANPEERGVLTKVKVTYPDGRAVIRTLLFPSVFAGKRWMGINICECGEGIRYIWSEDRSFQKAECAACGIVFVIEKSR